MTIYVIAIISNFIFNAFADNQVKLTGEENSQMT